MEILNLYAGIGGNRKLWGDNHNITAIENNPDIAKIYQDFFPNDKVIVCDAHQYLLEHFEEFDFIWSSPPCPTHSRICFSQKKKKYIDVSLWEEIILLKKFFKGKWVVENVITYYEPFIKPQEIAKHYFWSNFKISQYEGKRVKVRNDRGETCAWKMKKKGMIIKNWYDYKGDKRTLLNNAIEGELGLHILNNKK